MVEKKFLVIDTCVLSSASIFSDDLQAITCSEFLISVLDISHKIIFTQELYQEYKWLIENRENGFGAEWLADMESRRKVKDLGDKQNHQLREKINLSVKKNDQVIIKKDFHLIESALEGDNNVITLEDKVRKSLKKSAKTVKEIENIVWVNPEETDKEPIQWLENGAPPEQDRMLKSYSGG